MRVLATKIFTFDSAHYLPEHDGKCANIHGHTYKLEITIERVGSGSLIEEGPAAGMVMDFSIVKQIVEQRVIEQLDHRLLNDVVNYRPTAELMVVDIAQQLNFFLIPNGAQVVKAVLYETPTSFATVILERGEQL